MYKLCEYFQVVSPHPTPRIKHILDPCKGSINQVKHNQEMKFGIRLYVCFQASLKMKTFCQISA